MRVTAHQGRWGTTVELGEAGGTIRDRHGVLVARIEGGRAWVRGAPDRELTVEPPAPGEAEHPLFGRCARLVSGGELRSLMGEVRWAAPRAIPPVAEPARLPPLTGTCVLNLLAHCAQAAGVAGLYYEGPYPTPALFQSLRQSFTPLGDEAAFTARAEELLLAPRPERAPVQFLPAPFERWWPAPRLGLQAREHIERVFIDGAGFERSPTAIRRLVEHGADGEGGPRLAAELWFGDTRWATLAELTLDGEVRRGPSPPPPIDDPIVGQELPLGLRRALAQLIADAVPAPVAPLVEPILERSVIRWGDAGASTVRGEPGGAILHAALWITLRPRGAATLALALAEALLPWVVSEVVRGAS